MAVRWAIKNKVLLVLHTLAHSLSYDHNEHVVASIALLVQQRNSFHLTRFRHPSSRGSISLATRCVVDPPRALRVAILQRNIGAFVCLSHIGRNTQPPVAPLHLWQQEYLHLRRHKAANSPQQDLAVPVCNPSLQVSEASKPCSLRVVSSTGCITELCQQAAALQ